MEIKRELVVGELRDRRSVALPAMAALGGIIVPAVGLAVLVAIVHRADVIYTRIDQLDVLANGMTPLLNLVRTVDAWRQQSV